MIVFGKIRIPGVHDEKGEGFVHVRYVELSGFHDDINPFNNRIHDPPDRVSIKPHMYHHGRQSDKTRSGI